MLVEQADRLILLEAPAYPERAEAILDWVSETFASKRITHVVVTHFHSDHTGGVRTIAATGATVVVGRPTAGFFANNVLQRPSTIVEDALSTVDVAAEVVSVRMRRPVTLDDPQRPVTIYRVRNAHSRDMVVAHLPNQRMLFNSDLYSPDFPANNQPEVRAVSEEFYNFIVRSGIDVELLPSGHGFRIPTLADFRQEFGFDE